MQTRLLLLAVSVLAWRRAGKPIPALTCDSWAVGLTGRVGRPRECLVPVLASRERVRAEVAQALAEVVREVLVAGDLAAGAVGLEAVVFVVDGEDNAPDKSPVRPSEIGVAATRRSMDKPPLHLRTLP